MCIVRHAGPGLAHRLGGHSQSFLSSPITPASAQSSFGTSWMMTCRLVGLAPACCTMASVIALHSARFCAGERPGHICTVTTGMSRLLRQNSLDPRADSAPLTCSHSHRRPASETTAPDRHESKALGSVEIDTTGPGAGVHNQARV